VEPCHGFGISAYNHYSILRGSTGDALNDVRIELENAGLGVCADRVFAIIRGRIPRGVEKTRRPPDHVDHVGILLEDRHVTSARFLFPFPLWHQDYRACL
jgi:hypothetical protein